MDVEDARQTALVELEHLHPRRDHVVAVARLAASVEAGLTGADHEVLIAAAWLHGIGYGTRLAKTGFHPLDGARWLAARGEERLATLVANHSGAAHEARLRGLESELAEFVPEVSLVADLLTWCDLHVGPTGGSEPRPCTDLTLRRSSCRRGRLGLLGLRPRTTT